jgi:hypothetical protein
MRLVSTAAALSMAPQSSGLVSTARSTAAALSMAPRSSGLVSTHGSGALGGAAEL